MLSIRLVNTLEELHTLSDRWNNLLGETVGDNVFLTWEWLYTWSKHYLGSNQLWIILVYEGSDRLVGIAPFYLRATKRYGGLHVRELRFLGTEEVCSCYLDFIVPEKDKQAVLFSIYRYLHEEARGDWDVLTLDEVPAESSTIDTWDEFVQEDGKVMEVVGFSCCPIINLPGRVEEVVAGLTAKKRYNVTRQRKVLEREGGIVYQQVTSLQEIERELDEFIQLHQMRWHQMGVAGAFRSKRFEMYHRELCRILSQKGWVQLDFLLLNGEKIAGIYGYSYKGRYLYYLPGFNPNVLPQASPGTLLLLHRIEEAVRQGCVQFDLLRGAAGYKMARANGLRRLLTLRYYNKNRWAAILKLLEGGKDTLKILVR